MPPDAAQADPNRWYRKSFAGLPRWIRALTTRRILILGAAACYALILFNLIYGIASLARLKSWRPLPAVNAMELQRTMATPAENGFQTNWTNSPFAGGFAPAFCKTANMLEGPHHVKVNKRRLATHKSG